MHRTSPIGTSLKVYTATDQQRFSNEQYGRTGRTITRHIAGADDPKERIGARKGRRTEGGVGARGEDGADSVPRKVGVVLAARGRAAKGPASGLVDTGDLIALHRPQIKQRCQLVERTMAVRPSKVPLLASITWKEVVGSAAKAPAMERTRKAVRRVERKPIATGAKKKMREKGENRETDRDEDPAGDGHDRVGYLGSGPRK